MKHQPVSYVIAKVSHWPIKKQREYLMLAVQCEKGERHKALSDALQKITTRVLKQEMRGQHVRS